MNHSFDVEIAKQFGILEAVLMNHFIFWIEKNRANGKNYHDGRYWTYNSTKAFQELFPYASRRQIERALNHLRDEGILMVGNYNENKYDRTLWYAFTEKGESISRNGEMEIPENVNGDTEKGKPIPDTDQLAGTTDIRTGTREEKSPCPYDSFRDTYNNICTSLSSVRILTDKRKKAIKAFLKDFTAEQFREICTKANANAFLTGQNDRAWKADFDFLLRPDKAARILEGGYDNNGDRKQEVKNNVHNSGFDPERRTWNGRKLPSLTDGI